MAQVLREFSARTTGCKAKSIVEWRGRRKSLTHGAWKAE